MTTLHEILSHLSFATLRILSAEFGEHHMMLSTFMFHGFNIKYYIYNIVEDGDSKIQPNLPTHNCTESQSQNQEHYKNGPEFKGI